MDSVLGGVSKRSGQLRVPSDDLTDTRHLRILADGEKMVGQEAKELLFILRILQIHLLLLFCDAGAGISLHFLLYQELHREDWKTKGRKNFSFLPVPVKVTLALGFSLYLLLASGLYTLSEL